MVADLKIEELIERSVRDGVFRKSSKEFEGYDAKEKMEILLFLMR